ncbi:hypothetical protein DENSPDRAFT_836580 [Dentipellis sp. KUC8613]|nr:hypothetical protein DENSPDRAFT_836580 [Dentipellis sp. KUC8613]
MTSTRQPSSAASSSAPPTQGTHDARASPGHRSRCPFLAIATTTFLRRHSNCENAQSVEKAFVTRATAVTKESLWRSVRVKQPSFAHGEAGRRDTLRRQVQNENFSRARGSLPFEETGDRSRRGSVDIGIEC